ncbi:MAG: thiamine diphosphokinase [Clostridia bacterium]|nr:thiamine diphosphokinase [Clostridia bacterium]
MKGIILLNGEPYSGEIETAGKFVVCCDGALLWATKKGIRPDICVGDFDSLGYVPENAEVYPAEKNLTDGEIALDYLDKKGVKDIEIYGGAGKREDHFFGNVNLLIKAKERGINAVFKTDYTDFYVVCGKVSLSGLKGVTVSLVPVSDAMHINNSVGLKYAANGLVIRQGDSRGLSNVVTEDKASFEITEGRGILFIVRQL